MKSSPIALVTALALLGSPAQAQVLDLSTVKCKEFVTSKPESIGIILAWMNAYYKGEDDPPLIDFDKLAKDGERLGAHCAANPEMGLITAADALFDK
jgi:acid stress chaperone HdeB